MSEGYEVHLSYRGDRLQTVVEGIKFIIVISMESRRRVLVTPIIMGIYVTIKIKDLSERFNKAEEGDQQITMSSNQSRKDLTPFFTGK